MMLDGDAVAIALPHLLHFPSFYLLLFLFSRKKFLFGLASRSGRRWFVALVGCLNRMEKQRRRLIGGDSRMMASEQFFCQFHGEYRAGHWHKLSSLTATSAPNRFNFRIASFRRCSLLLLRMQSVDEQQIGYTPSELQIIFLKKYSETSRLRYSAHIECGRDRSVFRSLLHSANNDKIIMENHFNSY